MRRILFVHFLILFASGCNFADKSGPQGPYSGSPQDGRAGASLHPGVNLIVPNRPPQQTEPGINNYCWAAFVVNLDAHLNPIAPTANEEIVIQDLSGDQDLYGYSSVNIQNVCGNGGMGAVSTIIAPGAIWGMFLVNPTQAGDHVIIASVGGVQQDQETFTAVTPTSLLFLSFLLGGPVGAPSGPCTQVQLFADFVYLDQSTTLFSPIPGQVLYSDDRCSFPISNGVHLQQGTAGTVFTFYVQTSQAPVPLLLNDSSGHYTSVSGVLGPTPP